MFLPGCGLPGCEEGRGRLSEFFLIFRQYGNTLSISTAYEYLETDSQQGLTLAWEGQVSVHDPCALCDETAEDGDRSRQPARPRTTGWPGIFAFLQARQAGMVSDSGSPAARFSLLFLAVVVFRR